MRSDAVKKGPSRAPHRSLFKASGLTDEEIDKLMFKKWFGNTVSQMVDLIKIPLKAELDIIEMLQERYADTLSDIDNEIETLMKEFEALRSELVVE